MIEIKSNQIKPATASYYIATIKSYDNRGIPEEVVDEEPIERNKDETDRELIERALLTFSPVREEHYDKDNQVSYYLSKRILSK